MINTDKYEEHYGMTYEQLLKRYKDLEVDDYKDLLAEVKRMADKLRAEEDTHDLIEGKLREQVVELLAFYLRVKEIMDMEEIEEIVRVGLILQEMNE